MTPKLEQVTAYRVTPKFTSTTEARRFAEFLIATEVLDPADVRYQAVMYPSTWYSSCYNGTRLAEEYPDAYLAWRAAERLRA